MNVTNRYKILLVVLAIGMTLPFHAQAQKNKKNKDKKNPTEHPVLTAQDVRLSELFSDATTQKILGNYKDALNQYLMCIKLVPDHAASNYEVASIFAMSKQYEAALPYIQTAVKGEPENKWYLMLESQILVQTKKYKEAARLFEQLTRVDPDNYDHLLDLADVYILQGDYKSAIEEYNKLEAKVGVTAEVSLQKQKLYDAMNKFKQAVDEMQKLVDAYPNVAEYYGMFAELYLEHGKKEEAKALYEKVLQIDPENPVIHLALANYYQETGNPEKSFEYLKMAFHNPDVDIDDKIKILLSYYDISMTNQTRKKEAFELLDVLMTTHPEEAKAWSIKGDFLLRENKYEEAMSCFEKVLEYDNSKYPVWEQLLSLYVQQRNWEKLASQTAKALEVFPTQPTLYFYNGYANYQLKRYNEALTAFDAGKELVVDNTALLLQFYSSMGDCYNKLKKYTESDEAYDYVLAVDPNNISTLNNYAYYLSLRGEKLDKAKTMAEKLVSIEGRNPAYLDTYAWVLYKMGNYAEALRQSKTAYTNGGSASAEITEHYGDILYKNGEQQEALNMWIKAKELGKGASDEIDRKILEKKLID